MFTRRDSSRPEGMQRARVFRYLGILGNSWRDSPSPGNLFWLAIFMGFTRFFASLGTARDSPGRDSPGPRTKKLPRKSFLGLFLVCILGVFFFIIVSEFLVLATVDVQSTYVREEQRMPFEF